MGFVLVLELERQLAHPLLAVELEMGFVLDLELELQLAQHRLGGHNNALQIVHDRC